MAKVNKGLLFEFDNKEEAQAFAYEGAKVTGAQPEKVYRLEDDWWVVSLNINNIKKSSEKDNNKIDWPKVFNNLDLANLSYSKPDVRKGKNVGEVQLNKNIGAIFHDCPMSSRDALPFFLRLIYYKYKYVFLVFAPSTSEFKFMITHETFLLKSYICSFNVDGSHSNYGPIKREITKDEFLRIAMKISEDILQ